MRPIRICSNIAEEFAAVMQKRLQVLNTPCSILDRKESERSERLINWISGELGAVEVEFAHFTGDQFEDFSKAFVLFLMVGYGS